MHRGAQRPNPESIKAHGIPKGSFKPWEKELFGLRAYVESCRKREKPGSLTIDGPALEAPDGSCTVRIGTKQGDTLGGGIMKYHRLEIRGKGRQPEEVAVFAPAGDTFELFWGPKGSHFAVLVRTHSGTDLLEALDLRRGGSLRMEPDSLRAWVSSGEPSKRPDGR